MDHFGLPIECQKFLQASKDRIIDLKNERAEIEKVMFYSLDEMVEEFQIIDTFEYSLNHNEFEEDPEIQYHIPAINLIKMDAEDNYESDGLLVWIPILKCFGSFDIDHLIGHLFKDTAWNEIESKLGDFINTQWYPEKTKNILFMPWKNQGFDIDFNQYIKKSA